MPLTNPAIASISAGTTVATGPQVVLSNANGVAFGVAGNTITASYTVPAETPFGISASTQSVSTGTVVFSSSNGVSFGMSGSSRITASIDAVRSVVAGTRTATGSQISFADANGVSFGVATNNSVITASVAAGGGGGVATISKWPLAGDYGFGTLGAIATGASSATGGSTQWGATGGVWSVPFPHQVELSRIDAYLSAQAPGAGTGSATVGLLFGIYNLSAGTALSRLTSFQFIMEVSQNASTARTHRWYWGTNSASNSTQLAGNVSASFTGLRAVLLNESALTLTAGNYYFGHIMTARTSGANVFGMATIGYMSGSQTTAAPYVGASTQGAPYGFGGIFATTTNTNVITGLQMPGSIHTSAISSSISTSAGATQWRLMYTPMYRNT